MRLDFLKRLDLPRYLDGKVQVIIRCILVFGLFVAIVPIQGIADAREAQQIVFMLAMFALFSLILKNIWMTLFVLWSVFLYCFFKFETGQIYLSNIFLGSVLYLITKVAFNRKNISFYLDGFLWFVFANIAYMIFQVSGQDIIYSAYHHVMGIVSSKENFLPVGFMGHHAIAGFLMAAAIPILATRGSKIAWLGACLLFVPLFLAKTSLCFAMGFIGFLFVLWFKVPKRIFAVGIILASLSCGFYFAKVDFVGSKKLLDSSRIVQWKRVITDGMIHPITGWGLDSFRNITKIKDFKYMEQVLKYPYYKADDGRFYYNITHIAWWDNPHNLYVSLFYEWGGVGLFIFIGYLRWHALRFKRSIKELNVIGIAGFIIVFLGVSIGHFPAFLSRCMIFTVPMFAMMEILTE